MVWAISQTWAGMLKLAMVRHNLETSLYVGDRPERTAALSAGIRFYPAADWNLSINRYSSNSYPRKDYPLKKYGCISSPRAKAIGYIREVSRDA